MSDYRIYEDQMYAGPRMERMRALKRQQETKPQETRELVLSSPVIATPIINRASSTLATLATPVSTGHKENRLLNFCKCLVGIAFGIAMTTELGMYVVNAARQGRHALPWILSEVESWLPVSRDVYCYLLLLGLPGIGKDHARKGQTKTSICIWFCVACLFYYGLLINVQFTSTTGVIAELDKAEQINDRLMSNPTTRLIKETYDRAIQAEKDVKGKHNENCPVFDSTKCKRQEAAEKTAAKAVEDARRPYSTAVSQINTQAVHAADPSKRAMADLVSWASYGKLLPTEHDIANQQLFLRTAIALLVGVALAILI